MKHILNKFAFQITVVAVLASNSLSPLNAATRTAHYYDKTRIAVLEIGLFCDSGRSTRQDAPETTLGWIENIEGEVIFANHGNIVPAQLGINFGVKARAKVNPISDVRLKTTHPEFSVDGSTVGEWVGEIVESELTYKGFGFDYPYEMVLGDWTLEAYSNGALLYSITFTVVAPETVPWLAQMCQGNALLS